MKTNHKHWAVLTASTLGLTALVSATTLGDEKYTYDGSGNIIKKSINGQVTKMSYGASNRVTAISSPSKGNEQISYDAAGRPVSYSDASGQVTRELSYGYADKVLRADNNGRKAEFFYNAEGQLVGKAIDGVTTSYSWDGNVLAAQGEEAFTNEDHILGGVPILSGDQELNVSDYLGNTLSQGDWQLDSSAYGEGLEQGRFAGKAFVQELGGYIFHHRNYSPETNRWTVGDPIGIPDGKNSKSYVTGDPLSRIDPMGTMQQDFKVQVHKDDAQQTPQPHVSIKFTLDYTKTAVGSTSNIEITSYNNSSWSQPSVTVSGGTKTAVSNLPNYSYWASVQAAACARYSGVTQSYSKTTPVDTEAWEN